MKKYFKSTDFVCRAAMYSRDQQIQSLCIYNTLSRFSSFIAYRTYPFHFIEQVPLRYALSGMYCNAQKPSQLEGNQQKQNNINKSRKAKVLKRKLESKEQLS